MIASPRARKLRPGFAPRKAVGRRGGHCGPAGVGYAESCVTLYYNVAVREIERAEGAYSTGRTINKYNDHRQIEF